MCTFAEGVKISCTVSVPAFDEVAPHAVMRYALNAAIVKKFHHASTWWGSTTEDGLQRCHCSI